AQRPLQGDQLVRSWPMRPRDPHDSGRRRRRPVVERLEARDLPSSLASTGGSAPAVPVGTVSPIFVVGNPASAGRSRRTSLPDPAVIQNPINLLYGPNSATPMTPTPQEIRRQTFVAHWIGRYTVGAPRFSDRASTIHFYAVSGGSNQFEKGKFQMAL